MPTFRYTWLPDNLAVARLAPDAPIPDWMPCEGFTTVTRTEDELSIVCASESVPVGVKAERNWVALKVLGPLPFDAVGILRKFAEPLAEAGIPIIAIGTFDTDYVLVKRSQLTAVNLALGEQGLRQIFA
jgi:hypothetical protein